MALDFSRKNSLLGYYLKWFGFITLFGSFGLPIINVIWRFWEWWVAFLGSCFLYIISNFSLDLGKRMTALDAKVLLKKDTRPPILLLRPFSIDYRSFWLKFAAFSESAEDVLVTYLSHIGPVIAVGRPGEPIPPSGAARLYVPNEDWKATVEHLMSVSCIVVLILFSAEKSTSSTGFNYEIRQAIKLLNPQQLLIMLPKAFKNFPLGDKTVIPGLKWWMRGATRDFFRKRLKVKSYSQYYQKFLQQLNQELPYPLPPEAIEADFAYFKADWSPRLLRIGWFLGYWRMGSLLQPFLKSLNVPLPKMLYVVFKGQFISIMFVTLLLFNILVPVIYLLICQAFAKG